MTKKALLVGVNLRKDRPGLDGAKANVEMLATLLKDFEVKSLTDDLATRDNIIDGVSWLTKKSGDDEQVLVLAVSAHGKSINGESEFFAYDTGVRLPSGILIQAIAETDLKPYFSAVASSKVRIYGLYDCCRPDSLGERLMYLKQILAALFVPFQFAAPPRKAPTFSSPPGKTWLDVRGCQLTESCRYPNGEKGLFTWATKKAVQREPDLCTRKAVELAYELMEYPSDQVPDGQGPDCLLSRPLFS